MTITREELMAYADGELSGTEKARLEAAIAADPELGRQLAAEQALRANLAAHFAPVSAEPLPDEWLKMIDSASAAPASSDTARAGADIVSLAEVRAARKEPAPRWRIPAWGTGLAMAASLALGLVIGKSASTGGPVSVSGGALVADAGLAKALEHQLASATDTASTIFSPKR